MNGELWLPDRARASSAPQPLETETCCSVSGFDVPGSHLCCLQNRELVGYLLRYHPLKLKLEAASTISFQNSD
jgi:hypothetical protein